MNTNQHLEILGREATDKVTGFNGIVTSISFDLFGCIQALVNPRVDSEGNPKAPLWLDLSRLEYGKRVMDTPDFADNNIIAEGKKGPADKPILS